MRLVATFGKSWRGWLGAEAKVGRSVHEATYWLPAKPTAEVAQLGDFLLNNAARSKNDLGQICTRWSEVPAEMRQAGFETVREHLFASKYENVKDVAFAVEAGRWGMSPYSYAEREARYLKS